MKTVQKIWTRRAALAAGAVLLLAGCVAVPDNEGPSRKETFYALTRSMELITLNPGQPRRVQKRVAVHGLAAGDVLVSLDYRGATGGLHAVSRKGTVYALNVSTGALTATPAKPVAGPGPGWTYAPGDAQAAFKPDVVALAGASTNDDRRATHYAIDRRVGTLVVSSSPGQWRTVGILGTGPVATAAMDISEAAGAAFAALTTPDQPTTRLYLVNLGTGRAQWLGPVGDGAPLIGVAVAP